MLLIDVDSTCTYVYLFELQGQGSPKKKTYFCSLHETLTEYSAYTDIHLLLPESMYLFHTVHMEYASDEPFTISLYKRLVQEKLRIFATSYGWHPDYMHIIPAVGTELGPSAIKHLLGKKGKIQWTWHMFALSTETILLLRQVYGSNISYITCKPRNLAVIRSFSTLLQRTSFSLLTVTDQVASLCLVQEGWYQQFATAPLGGHILLETAEDQGVQKYLFRDSVDLQRNSVAQKLLLEALGFYASALADWVAGFLIPGSSLVFCCSLLTHDLFTEVMQATFQTKGAFMVPFASFPSGMHQHWQRKTDIVASAYLEELSSGPHHFFA